MLCTGIEVFSMVFSSASCSGSPCSLHVRTTGRRSWNEYILRSGELVEFVDEALRQPNVIQRFQNADYEAFRAERQRWNARLVEGAKRRRFRTNPQKYLQDVENKHCMLIGQS